MYGSLATSGRGIHRHKRAPHLCKQHGNNRQTITDVGSSDSLTLTSSAPSWSCLICVAASRPEERVLTPARLLRVSWPPCCCCRGDGPLARIPSSQPDDSQRGPADWGQGDKDAAPSLQQSGERQQRHRFRRSPGLNVFFLQQITERGGGGRHHH